MRVVAFLLTCTIKQYWKGLGKFALEKDFEGIIFSDIFKTSGKTHGVDSSRKIEQTEYNFPCSTDFSSALQESLFQ